MGALAPIFVEAYLLKVESLSWTALATARFATDKVPGALGALSCPGMELQHLCVWVLGASPQAD
jgi:hypothetical protein